MPCITSARILILATHGYERSELSVPLEQLAAKGATVKIASLKAAPITSWAKDNWGIPLMST
jgi:protease I